MLRVTRDQKLTTAITGSYSRPLWYDVNLRGQSFKAALGDSMVRGDATGVRKDRRVLDAYLGDVPA